MHPLRHALSTESINMHNDTIHVYLFRYQYIYFKHIPTDRDLRTPYPTSVPFLQPGHHSFSGQDGTRQCHFGIIHVTLSESGCRFGSHHTVYARKICKLKWCFILLIISFSMYYFKFSDLKRKHLTNFA